MYYVKSMVTELVPTHETEFAKDKTHLDIRQHLPDYVEGSYQVNKGKGRNRHFA